MHLSYSCYKQKSVDRSNDEPCCLPLPTADYSATAVISLQMSEVLDVSESSAITEFLKNERPLWPQIPTPCPVSECTNNKNYERFNDFMEHWKNIHNSVNTVYRCKLCKRLFGTMKHKKSHSQSRNHQGQKVEFEVIDKINEQYIDPKGTLPYQIGTPTFRKEMRELHSDTGHGVGICGHNGLSFFRNSVIALLSDTSKTSDICNEITAVAE